MGDCRLGFGQMNIQAYANAYETQLQTEERRFTQVQLAPFRGILDDFLNVFYPFSALLTPFAQNIIRNSPLLYEKYILCP
jgi:hypothetical protein